MTAVTGTPDGIGRTELDSALQKIASSPEFAGSPRMLRFLHFIVGEAAGGRAGELKETLIGVEVFDRDPGYDPKVDSIVRVEARRLRTKLRDYYLGAGAREPIVIDLPRGTYAPFITRVPVAQELPASVPVPDPGVVMPVPAPAHWRPRRLWLLLIAIPFLIGAIVLTRLEFEQPKPPIARLFTSDPGVETYPAMAPDGSAVAYVAWSDNVSGADIYVRKVHSDHAARLTTSPGTKYFPVWSPDQQFLYFVKRAPGGSAIFRIPAAGGTEQQIASFRMEMTSRLKTDVSPDGKYLVAPDRYERSQGSALVLIDVATGAKRRLTEPGPTGDGDDLPTFSPDGKMVAFQRASGTSVADVFRVPVDGSERSVVRVTNDKRSVNGLTWTARGSIIYSSSRRTSAGLLWRVRPDGGEPELIQASTPGASWPSAARKGTGLVWGARVVDVNIWRVPSDGGEAKVWISSTAGDTSPQYSPDGRRIAFRSARNMNNEIYVSEADGSNPVRVTDVGGAMTGSPRWSPDGRFLALDSRLAGSPDVYVVSAAGGPMRRLTEAPGSEVVPSWSRDGRVIYYGSDRGGRFEVWKQPAEGGAEIQVTKNGGFAPMESLDGRWLFYARGNRQPGLFRMELSTGREEPVVSTIGPELWGHWAPGREGVYYVEGGKNWRILYQSLLSSAPPRQICAMSNMPFRWDAGLAVSPDEKNVLFNQVDRVVEDLYVLDDLR